MSSTETRTDESRRAALAEEPLPASSDVLLAPDPTLEGPAELEGGVRQSRLKLVLVATDLGMAAAAWTSWSLVVDVAPAGVLEGRLRLALVATVLTVAAVGALHLYRARVCAVHALEIAGIAKATGLVAIALVAGRQLLDVEVTPVAVAGGTVLSFVSLLVGRRAFRGWLARRRRRGLNLRPVVVVGTNEEGRALVAMLRRNPEAGYEVVGLLGDRHGVANTGVVPWLGNAPHAAEVVRRLGANGAFFAASALAPHQLNESVRELMAEGRHVHLSNSLRGIAARRVRLQPISREMMFYLEPARLRRWEEVTKRAIDLTLAGLGLVVGSPVLLACALAVRLHDGGSPFFRQVRVGRGGAHFTLLKLRTMVPDAEKQVVELGAQNQRDGILFKLDDDPRVTPVGRLLRATSLDELPQLINVLRGEMSLVGPRPALPSEVAQFDERLLARHQVTPGVTGLWQVEAREVPGLGAYTRLDLFYVENWSVLLDLAILVATLSAVVTRAVRVLSGRPGEPPA